MNRRRRHFVKSILMVLDGLAICLTFVISYVLRNGIYLKGMQPLLPFYFYFPYLVTILVIWIVLLKIFNNYSFLQSTVYNKSRWLIFRNLIPVELVGLSSIGLIFFFTRDRNISRTFLLLFTILNYFNISLFKLLILSYFRVGENAKKYYRKALIIGHKSRVDNFLVVQKNMPELLVEVIVSPEFIISDNTAISDAELPLFSDKIRDYILENVVDELIFIYADVDISRFSSLITECSHLGLMVNMVLDTTGIEFQKTEIDIIGPYNVISFQSYDYTPSQRFMKRTIDVIGGFVGLVFFILLYLIIAPLIKLSSKGPVLFYQKRKGKNGRDFNLYKFRTMYSNAEERLHDYDKQNEMQGHMFKIKNDPRITPFGRFLRKSSLDEFPQFINIIKGEMSLVGTRPPTVDEFKSYETHHRRRLSVQPGLTGMWQVNGRNKITDFEEIVKLDTDYIDNWSIWLDLRIILKTFIVMFTGR